MSIEGGPEPSEHEKELSAEEDLERNPSTAPLEEQKADDRAAIMEGKPDPTGETTDEEYARRSHVPYAVQDEREAKIDDFEQQRAHEQHLEEALYRDPVLVELARKIRGRTNDTARVADAVAAAKNELLPISPYSDDDFRYFVERIGQEDRSIFLQQALQEDSVLKKVAEELAPYLLHRQIMGELINSARERLRGRGYTEQDIGDLIEMMRQQQ